ncbi:MAG: DUF4276 family protein [Methylovulum sp.]|uniref:DUF4276 family protein n=1 Tax=Methylovulum sp. TaxID=1916980 RepID=UPI0026379293|nr:DUF4276 family protein [Methylovulum sp.]MDD2724399.1 DUF4276 family protein [Methylovulum sp.]MDD5124016.1 DUF4276 family protein [Methylovulum sp.]
MHFEILVEGQCENTALSILMPKIIGEYRQPHTWNIRPHRGIGKLPENPAAEPNKNDQTLLHNLPAKLKSYGIEQNPNLVVLVLVDLDDKADCIAFKNQLLALLDYCEIKPRTLFRIAVEELEAWFLGDAAALKSAYPDVRQDILDNYVQDSQIGTWELLAEAIHLGGIDALLLKNKRSPLVLEEKRKWAKEISRHLNVDQNQSPSFCCFRDGLRRMAI